MNARRFFVSIFLPVILLETASYGQHRSQSDSATNILARIIDRAEQIAADTNSPKYEYEKRSRVEELNSRGEMIQSTEKAYRVVVIQGWPYSRLLKVQGQRLSDAEIRREDQKEQEFRNKVAGREIGKRRNKKELLVTPELLERYDFTVVRGEPYRGRNATVLEFKPKSNNPEENFQDKMYNRIAGKIWVDDEEAEISKLDAHLTEEVSLGWLGMLGSLKNCDLVMERQRMPDGVWVNAKHTLYIVARKLLSTSRYRASEESNNFRREPRSKEHALK